MTERNRSNPEVEALRERGAILRISASLDVDTVLQEVVDSARALTGARYGAAAACMSETSFSARRKQERSSPTRTRRSWLVR